MKRMPKSAKRMLNKPLRRKVKTLGLYGFTQAELVEANDFDVLMMIMMI